MSPTTNSSSPNKQQIDWQPSAYANKIQLAGMAIILKDPGLSNEMSVQPKVDPVTHLPSLASCISALQSLTGQYPQLYP